MTLRTHRGQKYTKKKNSDYKTLVTKMTNIGQVKVNCRGKVCYKIRDVCILYTHVHTHAVWYKTSKYIAKGRYFVIRNCRAPPLPVNPINCCPTCDSTILAFVILWTVYMFTMHICMACAIMTTRSLIRPFKSQSHFTKSCCCIRSNSFWKAKTKVSAP